MNGGVEVMIAAVAFSLGLATGAVFQLHDSELVAARNGAGQYNPRTGNFEWITPDDPERDYALKVRNEMIMNRLNSQKCE